MSQYTANYTEDTGSSNGDLAREEALPTVVIDEGFTFPSTPAFPVLYLRPRTICAGIGCKRNMDAASIEEALLSREIPPLLLLTFVENAVKHAELNAWNLTVCILVSRLEEQQKLRFIVKNNGSKFPDEYLELLNDPAYYLDGGSHGGRGVGIRNIHKRLSLIYGNRFSLHFYNSDKGACVEILLPDEEIRPAAEMNFSADSNKLADK